MTFHEPADGCTYNYLPHDGTIVTEVDTGGNFKVLSVILSRFLYQSENFKKKKKDFKIDIKQTA